jgi:isoamylase
VKRGGLSGMKGIGGQEIGRNGEGDRTEHRGGEKMSKYKLWVILAAGLLHFIGAPRWSAGFTVEDYGDTGETEYGAHVDQDRWVHFVVFSPDADQVNLLLFGNPGDTTPEHTIPMKRSGDDWKIRVKGEGIGPGLLYLYQAKGPNEVSKEDQYGLMFNENFFLNDPYCEKTQGIRYSSVFLSTPFTDVTAPLYAGGGKCMVYDHSQDADPGHVRVNREDLIIYELHVQDYTSRIDGLDAAKRGTYLGLAQSGLKTPGGLTAGIDHLAELGVTAVELMPVMEYDEETGNAEGRYNHWGYMTTNFFAPEARYSSVEGAQVVELKQLIKAFHDQGIQVILDTVYNHTAEQGPWLDGDRLAAKRYNLMGLSNTRVFRATGDGRYFTNSTGTGNDVSYAAGDDTFTKRMVRDSLSLWTREYGIDGFRFDLARILADGSASAADWIDNDDRFSSAHLHAEPWDMGGQWWDFMDNYGWSHENNRWAKWLGKYRDKTRKFSASGLKNRTAFKQLIEGYGSTGDQTASPASTKPWRSVNFLAVHDGYTLRDCVSYNDSDGSQNCWDSGGDENLRREREKLLLGILFTSQGVPLLLQGDEFGRTKSGASSQADARNTYNYESTSGDKAINNVNWIDWRLKDSDNNESPEGPQYGRELFNWTRDLIRLRKKWTHFRRSDFPVYADGAWNGGPNAGAGNDGEFTYVWEGPPDGEPTQLAVLWWGGPGEPDLMVLYNESREDLAVSNLGNWSQGNWKVLARSWYGDEHDFCDIDHWADSCGNAGTTMTVKARSMALLISDND